MRSLEWPRPRSARSWLRVAQTRASCAGRSHAERPAASGAGLLRAAAAAVVRCPRRRLRKSVGVRRAAHAAPGSHCGWPCLQTRRLPVAGGHQVPQRFPHHPPLRRGTRRRQMGAHGGALLPTMITHNKFDIQTFRNDIALVRLAEPVDLEGSNANLQTVCLPDESMDFSKARCMATGWGETQFKGRHSDVLMEVMLPVWPHDKCARAYKNYNKITTSMFCAGYVEGKKSSCSGDSGGPLQCTFDERTWFLAGVVSHSVYCALPNMPTVFTKVAPFLDFIQHQMGQHST
ncbi:anionic trypsin-2-like isoform X2 [Dermacentor andersoni]|uniref:anionic trypsin-2-like isoform X2 n=1 Tax=Dermacentor andersoni TaxID=34620 RepID=UPI0024166BBB|nr:proclotting enzyme-like isoform X2 [Dermacentor andersoni]